MPGNGSSGIGFGSLDGNAARFARASWHCLCLRGERRYRSCRCRRDALCPPPNPERQLLPAWARFRQEKPTSVSLQQMRMSRGWKAETGAVGAAVVAAVSAESASGERSCDFDGGVQGISARLAGIHESGPPRQANSPWLSTARIHWCGRIAESRTGIAFGFANPGGNRFEIPSAPCPPYKEMLAARPVVRSGATRFLVEFGRRIILGLFLFVHKIRFATSISPSNRATHRHGRPAVPATLAICMLAAVRIASGSSSTSASRNSS